MSAIDYDIPDLHSILQTLKAFTPAKSSFGFTSEAHAHDIRDVTGIPSYESSASVIDSRVEDEHYKPEEPQSITGVVDQLRLGGQPTTAPTAALPYGIGGPTQEDKPRQDPATIIDWLVGVRYTTVSYTHLTLPTIYSV